MITDSVNICHHQISGPGTRIDPYSDPDLHHSLAAHDALQAHQTAPQITNGEATWMSGYVLVIWMQKIKMMNDSSILRSCRMRGWIGGRRGFSPSASYMYA